MSEENFTENVLIRWDYSQPQVAAKDLETILLSLDNNLNETARTATRTGQVIRDSFGTGATGVTLLNAELTVTLGLLTRLQSAAGTGTLNQAITSAAGSVLGRASWEKQNIAPSAGMAGWMEDRAARSASFYGLGPEQGGGAPPGWSVDEIKNLRQVYTGELGFTPGVSGSPVSGLRQEVDELTTTLSGNTKQIDRVTTSYDRFGNTLDRVIERRVKEYNITGEEIRQLGPTQVFRENDPGIRAMPAGANAAFQIRNLQDMIRLTSQARDESFLLWKQTGDPAAQQLWQKQNAEVEKYGTQLKALSPEVNNMGQAWLRHLGWIAQTIVLMTIIHTTYRAIREVVGGIVRETLALQDATARLAFIRGTTPALARSEAMTAGFIGAQYGAEPGVGNQMAIQAAQTGASKQTLELAAQFGVVYGDSKNKAEVYNNALQELVQTEKLLAVTGVEGVRVQDTIAVMYQRVPGTLEEYFDALQVGIQLESLFGVEAETMGLAIREAAYAGEQSAEVLRGTLGRLALRLPKPEFQKELAGFGVTDFAPQAAINQIAQISRQLIASGQMEKAAEFLSVVTGGSIQAGQDVYKLQFAFAALADTMNEAGVAGGEFQTAMDLALSTTSIKVDQLTASWHLFLQSLGQTPNVQGVMGFVDKLLTGYAQFFQIVSLANRYEAETGAEAFTRLPGKMPGSTKTSREYLGLLSGYSQPEDAFMAWAQAQMGGVTGGRGSGAAQLEAYRNRYGVASVGGELLSGAPAPFGGMLPIGEGVTQQSLQRRANEIAEEFAKITGYVAPAVESFALVNEANNTFVGKIVGPGDAVKAALRELEAAAKDASKGVREFGGIRDLPENRQGNQWGRFQQEVLSAQAFLQGQAYTQGIPYDPKEQIFMVFDEANNTMRPIIGTMDAFNMALKKSTDVVAQFGGFRDIPEGANIGVIKAMAEGIWQQRVVGAQAGVQDYEKKQEFKFWDTATKSWVTIVSSQDALRFAIDENTKATKQITGVFNVPAGSDALFPFSALLSGIVPKGVAEQEMAGGAGGSASLNQAGGNLINAATNLNTAASALISAATIARMSQGMQYSPALRTPSAPSVPQVSDAQRAAMSQGMQYSPALTAPQATNVNLGVNVNNRNVINLDGRVIAQNIQQQLYQRTANLRQSTGGSRNNLLLM